VGSQQHMRRAAVIYYPGRVDRTRFEAMVARAVDEKIWGQTLWLPTTETDHGLGQTKIAIEAGVTNILIAGGDGTIRDVIEALIFAGRNDIAVGIVLVGTGNILARNLNMNLNNLQQSVERGLNGVQHEIDVGLARMVFEDGRRATHYFTALAGVGLDARIMANTRSNLKRQIGWIAYIEGGLRALPAKFDRLTVSVDGRESRQLKLYSLMVGNAGWLPGNMSLLPDARLDDGKLAVAAIGPRRIWNWIDFWSRVTWQNRVVRPLALGRRWMEQTANLKTLEYLSGSKIEVRPERPVDIQLDGDPMGRVIEVHFEVDPKALKILI